MASTNKTPNYELSQFVETDRPAWLTDYNGDLRTLDTALKTVSDVASGASGSISSLTDRMTAAEGAISTNANDIDTLEARADALEAGAQSQAGTIAGIQTEQIAQNAGIEAATELGYNLARPYDSASTYEVGDYVLFQNTLYKCIAAVPVGEAFVPAKWLAIKATDEIAAGGYTLPIASANRLGGVKVGNNLSIDPETGVLSGASPYTLPIASGTRLGGVKVGNGLNIDGTGVLSASGGDFEIIPLTNANITITPSGTTAYTLGSDYFSATAGTPGTQTSFTGFSATLQPTLSFYAKKDKLRILRISFTTNYNNVNIPSKSLFLTDCSYDIGGNVIEAPVQDSYAPIADPNNSLVLPININSCAEFTTNKKLRIKHLLYNGREATTSRYLYDWFYFIYYVK